MREGIGLGTVASRPIGSREVVLLPTLTPLGGASLLARAWRKLAWFAAPISQPELEGL